MAGFMSPQGDVLPVWSDTQTFQHSDVCDLCAKNAAGSARL